MDSDDLDTGVPRISPFESIHRITDDDSEYWSARDLAKILGYAQYNKFTKVIAKAKESCENSAQAVSDHFTHMSEMIETGKGAKREFDTVYLSRYACYLIVQNADPSKPIVALGQTYFAVQTRRQELQEELAPLTEDQLRVLRRSQMNVYNTQLAGAAQNAGVITSIDFAIFQDHGYQGLYGGLKARGIHARKGLKKSQEILDYMGSDELAANIFRASQTKQKLEREQIKGKEKANRAHLEVGKKVRQTIVELGGTLPEDLPTPAKSIQQLQREEQKLLDQKQQPSLFEDEPADAG